MGAEKFGKYYWCIKVSRKLSPEDGEIYVFADEMRITATGALEAIGNDGVSNLTIAKGNWYAYFSADGWDGGPFAVEWWTGLVKNLVGYRIAEGRMEDDSEGDASKQKKIAQKPNGSGYISKSLRFDVLRRDNFTCRLCGATGKDTTLEVDHIIPQSKGGTSTLDNLQTLCIDCNRGKKAKMAVVSDS